MSFLLLEDGSKLLQETGDGILLDEVPVDFQDVAQLNVGNMTCILSIDFGNFIAVISLNLGDFKVLADG